MPISQHVHQGTLIFKFHWFCPVAKQHEHVEVEARAKQLGGSVSGESAPWDVFVPDTQVRGAAGN